MLMLFDLIAARAECLFNFVGTNRIYMKVSDLTDCMPQ